MSDIKWEKKYEIGHERIDFEHQIFVDLIAKIDDAVKNEKDKKYIERLLNEFQAYATFHFISEENIMYSINYPDFEIHKKHHNELLDKYNQKLMEIDLNEQKVEDLIVFLKDWFVNHTLNEDKKIAIFVEGKYI
ncbi:MAG: hemerythrin family protein [Bacteroidetes bacterium]|nr:hemerythrin family protein [Bacteroidota bacterium]